MPSIKYRGIRLNLVYSGVIELRSNGRDKKLINIIVSGSSEAITKKKEKREKRKKAINKI